jgi:putative oxidoreductase
MKMIKKIMHYFDSAVAACSRYDFIALLCIRLYLLPVIYVGAYSKVVGFNESVAWFGASSSDGGLGLPFPFLFAFLAVATEVAGLICIALGLFTRVMAIPMMILMSAASAMVHLPRGWLAIADKGAESSQRLAGLLSWLTENFPGRYNYITEFGDPVILNNGMEFAATYFVMLLVLFFYGGGRFVSMDFWIRKKLTK